MEFKYDLQKYMNYLIDHVQADPNITVRTGTEATAEMIAAMGFDTVLAATGSVPAIPPLPGVDGENVMTVNQAFFSGRPVGHRVVVIGGGQTGCEVGVHFAMQDRQVTILGRRDTLSADATRTYREELQGQVADHCAALTGCACTAITPDGVTYRDRNGDEHFVEADTVILATGVRATAAEAEAFRGCAPAFRAFGDCVAVGNVQKAVRAGYDAAMCVGW